jgi:AraC-like DNA-binding protein
MNGRPGVQWAFRSEGAAAFSMSILLAGRVRTAFDNASALDVDSGSVILMASGKHTAGWNVLDGKVEGVFRMVSLHFPRQHMQRLTGLRMDDLCDRMRANPCASGRRVAAFLDAMPASNGLRRVTCDLLGLASTHPGPCVAHDLYLRAKALEALACFLRENLARHEEATLPVPTDRLRLLEARALLEKYYDRDWRVQTLAQAVGLNEKRLQSGFQVLFGDSVYAFLTAIRIDAAVALLQHGVSVTETATRCGFSNLSHFSRMFSRRNGVSPKQYALGLNQKTLPAPVDDAM